MLDLATRWTKPRTVLALDQVHRFADPDYAALTLLMRTGERSGEVFDQLLERGDITIHSSEAERHQALATIGSSTNALLVADGREQVAELNALVRDRRAAASHIQASHIRPVDSSLPSVTTGAGERLTVGDRVATRRNAPDLGVANRETWTVTATSPDGAITVEAGRRKAVLPREHVAEHVQLAYAATVYGAQGTTVSAAHFALGEQTGAASAYVAMTRGRHRNTAHLTADGIEDARQQWVDVFNRDRADLGPHHARTVALDDLDRYGPNSNPPPPIDAATRKTRHGVVPDLPPHPTPSAPSDDPGLRPR